MSILQRPSHHSVVCMAKKRASNTDKKKVPLGQIEFHFFFFSEFTPSIFIAFVYFLVGCPMLSVCSLFNIIRNKEIVMYRK